MFIRCPFCHKLIFQWFYDRHEQEHTRRKPDGQMKDHVTNAPGDRYRGSLSGVPRTYRHPRCGRGTVMPEEIIRSYLANPLLYGDRSFCTGCNDYVDTSELSWVETGENMLAYTGQLRAEYLQRAYGISRARQREQVVVITPPAERLVREQARHRGFQAPFSCVLKRGSGKASAAHFCEVVDDWDPQTYRVVLEGDDVHVIVPKAQVDVLRGTILHIPLKPKKGFQVCRLYPSRVSPQ